MQKQQLNKLRRYDNNNYGQPQYRTQYSSNKQYLREVDPSRAGSLYADMDESSVMTREGFQIYNPDISSTIDINGEMETLHSQDIYQTKQIDYQDIYNNNGQYIDLQRRTLFPGLTISESQQMQQANNIRQGNIILRDARAYKTGNQIMDSTIFQNIAQRVEKTGQLLPSTTPYGGWQQGLTNDDTTQGVNPISADKENFINILDYNTLVKAHPEVVTDEPKTEEFRNCKKSEKYQEFDTEGKLMQAMKMFKNQQPSLPQQQQQYLIAIVRAMITSDRSIFNEVKNSDEFAQLPFMVKFNIYRLDRIIASGNINKIAQ